MRVQAAGAMDGPGKSRRSIARAAAASPRVVSEGGFRQQFSPWGIKVKAGVRAREPAR